MAIPQRLDNVFIDTLTARVFNPPAGSIDDNAIEDGANIAASKIERHDCADAELFATTNLVSAVSRVMHTVRGTTGTLLGLELVHFSTALTTTSIVYVDLQKATSATTWTSVLTTGVTIASSDAAYTPRAATISTASLNDGDILRLAVATSGASTDMPRGLTAHLTYTETFQ